jgi:hypothetical protein
MYYFLSQINHEGKDARDICYAFSEGLRRSCREGLCSDVIECLYWLIEDSSLHGTGVAKL